MMTVHAVNKRLMITWSRYRFRNPLKRRLLHSILLSLTVAYWNGIDRHFRLLQEIQSSYYCVLTVERQMSVD
jgi:hypothetical protein